MAKLVTCMGFVYKLTEANYRKMLTAVKKDGSVDLDTLGKCIGIVTTDVTDLTSEEAVDLLNDLKEEKKNGTRKL